MVFRLFFAFCLLFLSEVKSETAYELNLPYSFYFGNSNLQTIGIGVRGIYFVDDWSGLIGGMSLNLPTTVTGTIEFSATNGYIEPGSLIKVVKSRLSSYQFSLGFRRYFIGDYLSTSRRKFALSAVTEVGLLFGSYVSEVPEYDAENYESRITEDNKGSFINYIASAGLEGDYAFAKFHLFSELRIGASIDQANRKLVDVELPTFISVNFGIRLPIGQY